MQSPIITLDNTLHAAAGAALAAPMVLAPDPITTFLVFSAWGLLREQAQRNDRDRSFAANWFHLWNRHKVIEGIAWGAGGALSHWSLERTGPW